MSGNIKTREVLIVHHGNILGGAPVSLKEQARVMQNDDRLDITIACHAQVMRDFFEEDTSLKTLPFPDPITYLGKLFIGHSHLNSFAALRALAEAFLRLPLSLVQQIRFFRKRREAMVHLNSATLFVTAIAAKLAGKKITWHVREAALRPRPAGAMIRSWASMVVAISEIEAKSLGGADQRVRVVYNPVNLQRFDPKAFKRETERQRWGLSKNATVILLVGGVSERKGALESVLCLEHLPDSAVLLVAGPPLEPGKNRYHDRVQEALHRVGKHRVHFTGILKEPEGLFAAADLLVFPGKTPHFARPIFEAWAMALPVVVFRMEGISQHVEHGTHGLVVEEHAPKPLAEAILKIFNDPGFGRTMGKNGLRDKAPLVDAEESGRSLAQVLLDA